MVAERVERIRVTIPYSPRPQFLAYHQRTQRWACLVIHRRAGKTVGCINDGIKRALQSPIPNGRYAYIAPFRTQAKEVAWDYLKRYTQPVPGATPHEGELRVDLPNGARIRLHGADNADALRGGYLDGVVLDEYADMDPRVWPEIIRPMLADRKGWATFIGTPKGRNDFHRLHEAAAANPAEWFSQHLRASQSGIIIPSELEAARKEMTQEQFAQEFECSFDAAIIGAYYGSAMADVDRGGRIGEHSVDPLLPVHTAWDLGKDDPTAIWFYKVAPDGIRVIDYYEAKKPTSLHPCYIKVSHLVQSCSNKSQKKD